MHRPLGLIIILSFVLTLGCRSAAPKIDASALTANFSAPLSIMQGVTSPETTRFSVVVPDGAKLKYEILSEREPAPVRIVRVRGPRSAAVVDQLDVGGLKLGVLYQLKVTSASGEIRDLRQFRTLDPLKPHARIAVISCMDDHLSKEAAEMWPQVISQRPDAILLIGDNVYADHVENGQWRHPTPESLWLRYIETRRDLPLYYARELTPIVATWDDHDFAHNDADRTFPYRHESKDTFFAFFPQAHAAPGFTPGPGVASRWDAFGLEMVLTDDRFFRSPDKKDTPDQTHFGPEQEAWIDAQFTRAREPVLLISGDQFFGGYHAFESYEGSHPRSFRAALARWAHVATPLLFVSGDRHLSEIMNIPADKIGFPTFEVTSSGIHASVFAGAFTREPNPRQLVGVAGELNYSILEVMRAEPHVLRVGVQAFGRKHKLLYQRTLTVKR